MSKATTEKLKNQLAKKEEPQAGLKVTLERQKAEITRALPKGMDADRFLRIVLTTVRTSPDLTDIANRNPMSIIGACMLSAQLGLEPGPLGLAYIVPFNNKRTQQREAQLIIGYKGIINLARRSGEILTIEARAVMPADYFRQEYGLEPVLEHRPNWDDQSGEPVLFYGVVKFTNGGTYHQIVTPQQIEEHRRASKQGDSGPWKSNRLEMSLKTVIRIMQPWLPLSTEAAQGMLADGAVTMDLSGDMAAEAAAEADYIDVEGEEVEDDEIEDDPNESEPEDADDTGRPFE